MGWNKSLTCKHNNLVIRLGLGYTRQRDQQTNKGQPTEQKGIGKVGGQREKKGGKTQELSSGDRKGLVHKKYPPFRTETSKADKKDRTDSQLE